ncbi:hypothetical protein COLO4_37435 [Corchorus olitorius]|uniref:Transcription repressor n=1 Tax=Corchorus olitorius TaxID=93759 RepID=A0A1R3G1S6_9ROSI|nr:hypothetical protein COLO4_37435 [Corchorus olitorius]
MKLVPIPSLFKKKEEAWQWGSCKHPKTLSFRAGNDDVFKTVNSIFLDEITTTTSCSSDEIDPLEMVVKGARSERLFFEPGGHTSSILAAEAEPEPKGLGFKESVVLAMDSADPYLDFRRSMEEMVETHGLKDWECLEELLAWYLKVNGKTNHGFIITAFIDLLLDLSSSSSNNSSSTSYSSAISSFPPSPLCSSQGDHGNNEIQEQERIVLP